MINQFAGNILPPSRATFDRPAGRMNMETVMSAVMMAGKMRMRPRLELCEGRKVIKVREDGFKRHYNQTSLHTHAMHASLS